MKPPPSDFASVRRAAESVLGLRGATKIFGGTVALKNVSLDLRAGEVLALLGENGAGKSTCVKLLTGLYKPDEGEVVLDGFPVELTSPLDAFRRGISVVHQHPGLFGDLTVSENIFIGHMPVQKSGRLDRGRMQVRARELLELVGLDCDPGLPLSRLRSSEQQLVEIARALSAEARVLVLDEPTAALSQREVERLFSVMAQLRGRQVAMLFVSHRMDEIYRVSDWVTVLRDGQHVATEPVSTMSRDRAVQLMVGRSLSGMYPPRDPKPGEVVLEVSGLGLNEVFRDVSFAVGAGEIIGLGGLVGSGRTDIARVIFGIDQPTEGTIRLQGRPVSFHGPGDALAAGIAYLSEDRLGQSLVMDQAILSNATLPTIERATVAGLISGTKELALVRSDLDRMRLRFRSYEQPVNTLSGGNQQKVVLAKWLATKPRLLILDEPTQGVDVQTKAEVHNLIADLAGNGMAIILISSELPELLGMSDRILVFREGRVRDEMERAAATPERILKAATDAVEKRDPDHRAGESSGEKVIPPQPKDPIIQRRSNPIISAIRHLLIRREFGLITAMAAVTIPVAAINPRMLSGPNLTSLSMDASLLLIVAVAQMLVLLTRNIDLSVASVIGLSAYGVATTLRAHPDLNVCLALGLASGIGLLCGLVNGVVVTVGRVPAIVVTLGTLSVFRGIDSLWTGGKQISADQVPQAWLDLTSGRLLGIPAVVFIAAAVLLVAGFVLRSLPMGRELYAIGSSPDGAELIGIPVKRRVLGAFAVAGLLAGFDGGLWASRYATIDARVATGYELTVIAAVVVGGVAIRGGAGTVLGVTLGALTLLLIRNGLVLIRVDPLWLDGVYGLVILGAVTINLVVTGRSQTHLRRKPA
ncbi:MAG: ATP-binding cassette domain-containing protein [Verrucomicrobia bacterium]|nr:ATP-binding cassette domain-containing protein [Verrucomicrobiota bacterium]